MSNGPLYLGRRGVLKAAAGVGLGIVGEQLFAARPAGAVTPLSGADTSYVIDCAGWSARPPSSPISLSNGTTNRIIVHQTEWPNTTDYSQSRAIALAQEIQDLHMDTNGWIDTGQHFTVSRGGYVLEGRHRSLEGLNNGGFQPVSAHAIGENTRAIGIENEGTYFTETPPQMLLDSLVQLLTDVCTQYGLGAHRIFGHWDFNDTDCPGYTFYPLFPQLRLRTAQALAQDPASIPARTWPDPYSSSAGAIVVTVQYLLRAQGYQLKTDGSMSNSTLKAISGFQKAHGLTVSSNGTVTQPTWEALATLIGPGATGSTVLAAQSMLGHKGYSVTANGTYDEATISAVADMQQLHGLPQTGSLDTASWCATVGGIVAEEFSALGTA